MKASELALSARQRGDFQTPLNLARRVWELCGSQTYDVVVEPTFGTGAFLETMPESLDARVVGWEIDKHHFDTAQAKVGNHSHFDLIYGDVFDSSSKDLQINATDSVLVIGNPPWITNAEQGVLGGANTGTKNNLNGVSGINALTGSSNFDISEAIILHFVRMLRDRCANVRFALLVKFSVARKLLHGLSKERRVGDWEFHHINAAKHFGAAVEAGLLLFTIGDASVSRRSCRIYSDLGESQTSEIGFRGSHLIYDLQAYDETSWLESHGASHYIWRQGVKHDVSSVLELTPTTSGLTNKQGEYVEIEDEALFRFFKSSDLYNGNEARYLIPIYQTSLSDTLEDLPLKFPKLCKYLEAHTAQFRARKSSIYHKRPDFSLFGIGDYTTAPYKVAIGSLYKEPRFRLLCPTNRRAVVDDTSYLIAADSLEEAVFILALLELPDTKKFLLAISCKQDKRRWSKSILERLMLPSMQQCPLPLRREISDCWKRKGEFSASVFNQLSHWIQAQRLF